METPTVTLNQIAILKAFTKTNKTYSPIAPSLVRTSGGGAVEPTPGIGLFSKEDMNALEACGLIERFSVLWDDFWILTDLGIATRRMAA